MFANNCSPISPKCCSFFRKKKYLHLIRRLVFLLPSSQRGRERRSGALVYEPVSAEFGTRASGDAELLDSKGEMKSGPSILLPAHSQAGLEIVVYKFVVKSKVQTNGNTERATNKMSKTLQEHETVKMKMI